MSRFVSFLQSLNPFRAWLDYKLRLAEITERIEAANRAEKAEERQAFITALQATAQVSLEASKASQSQAQALKTFLDSFNVTAAPQRRDWDEEADNRRYIEEHMPAELKNMDPVDRMHALVDKFEASWGNDS